MAMPNKHRMRDARCLNCGVGFKARVSQVGKFCTTSCGALYRMKMDALEAVNEEAIAGGERSVDAGRAADGA